MPLRVVGQNPFGVVVQKGDGDTVTVPHGLVKDVLGPLLAQAAPPPDGPLPPDAPVSAGDISDALNAPPPAPPPDAPPPPAPTDAPGDVPAPPAPPPDASGYAAPSADAPASAQPPVAPPPVAGPPGAAPSAPPSAPGAAPPQQGAQPTPASVLKPEALQEAKGAVVGATAGVGKPPAKPPAAGAGGGGVGQPDPAKALQRDVTEGYQAGMQAGEAAAQYKEYAGPRLVEAAKTQIAATNLAEQQFQTLMGKVQAQSDALRAEVDALSKQRIDPDNYLSSMSTAGKLSTLTGLLIGGYVSTRTGGRNDAAETMKMLINNDIHAQIENLANGRALAQQKLTILQQDVMRGMDIHSAATKAAATAYNQQALLIEAEGAKYQAAGIRANAAVEANKQRLDGDKALSSLYQAKMQDATQRYGIASHEKIALMEDARKQKEFEEREKERQTKDFQERAVYSPIDGKLIGLAHEKGGAIKATEINEKAYTARQALKRYADKQTELGRTLGTIYETKARQELLSAQTFAMNAVKDFADTGKTTSPTEMEAFVRPLVPDPRGIVQISNPVNALNATLDNMDKYWNTKLQAYVPGAKVAPAQFGDYSIGGQTGSRGNAAPTVAPPPAQDPQSLYGVGREFEKIRAAAGVPEPE